MRYQILRYVVKRGCIKRTKTDVFYSPIFVRLGKAAKIGSVTRSQKNSKSSELYRCVWSSTTPQKRGFHHGISSWRGSSNSKRQVSTHIYPRWQQEAAKISRRNEYQGWIDMFCVHQQHASNRLSFRLNLTLLCMMITSINATILYSYKLMITL